MGNSIGQAVVLVVNTLGGLLVLALLLRFLLQVTRADFYNPVSQSLVKMTSFVLNPLRKFIPSWRNVDIVSVLVALIFSTLATALMIAASGFVLPGIGTLISWTFLGVLSMILKIYKWGLVISIIASWVVPHSGNPVLLLIHQLLDPLQSLFRKVIPPMGGLDFSPIFIFLGIQVVEIMVVGSLRQGFGLSTQVAQFVIGI
ncbi:MAG: YggT family protein [Gammaproteobacteria bacterium]|nr:YggT family protein [Gammaproteobacteria bacterium]